MANQLKDIEEKFEIISENIPGTVLQYKLNPDGTDELLYLSKNVEKLWEVSHEKAIRDVGLLWERVHESDLEDLKQSIRKSQIDLSYWEHEYRIRIPDGKIKWIQSRGIPKRSKDGSTIWDTILLEITDKKNIEKELKESEEKYRNISSNVPGIVLKYKLNADGTDKLLFLSETVEKIYEISHEEAINNIDLLWERIHKDDLKAYVESIQQSQKNLSYWETEHRIQMPDGRVKWILARGVPKKHEDGSVVWDTLGIDITRLKTIERELISSEEKFKEIFNSTSEAIFIYDFFGGIHDCNYQAIKMYGFDSKEELLQTTIAERSALHDDFNQNTIDRQIRKAVREGKNTFEWLAKRKNEAVFWVEVSLSRTRIGGNGFVLAVIRDISERKTYDQKLKNALEKAEESDRLKTAFLANISHEIRTPMNGILGFAELLHEANYSPEEQKKYIKIIHQNSERLINTINDLVDISRIESGQGYFEFQ